MILKKLFSGLSIFALIVGSSSLLKSQCEASYYEDEGDIVVPIEFPSSWGVINVDIDYKPY